MSRPGNERPGTQVRLKPDATTDGRVRLKPDATTASHRGDDVDFTAGGFSGNAHA
jgi:hypothetical protein